MKTKFTSNITQTQKAKARFCCLSQSMKTHDKLSTEIK